MIKLFLDTNIILDVMAQREPFNASANSVLKIGIEGRVVLCATPLTFANCAYILKKSYKHADPIRVINAYKQYIFAAPMDDAQCEKALSSKMPDFEDMLQYEAAFAYKCDYILTRNKQHFPTDGIPILSADEFIKNHYS